MKIYHYDPLTRLFLFEDVAPQDPLDPTNFLVPAWATGQPPLTKIPKGKQTYFNGDQWALRDIPLLDQPETSNPLTDEEKVAFVKAHAKSLLVETDYTQAVDVSSMLLNFEAFVEYRRQVREIFLEPIIDPVWPVMPTPQWE